MIRLIFCMITLWSIKSHTCLGVGGNFMFIFQDNFGANIQILTNKRHTVHSGLQGLTKTENINKKGTEIGF